MSEAILSAAVTLLVCMINNYYQMRKSREQHSKTIALVEYRLDELTKRVDKHSNVIERTYKLEEVAALQEEKIRVANNRIEDLEKEKKDERN